LTLFGSSFQPDGREIIYQSSGVEGNVIELLTLWINSWGRRDIEEQISGMTALERSK
jgi:hypothetical protein